MSNPNEFIMNAAQRKWDNDPYYAERAAAVRWLGDRYLLAQPVKRKGDQKQ